jgi:hypothetical protein
MSEVPDLSMIFGPPQAEPTAEQREHMRKVYDAQRAAELLAYAQVQFFAPVLCNCDKRYDRDAPMPPQLNCVVHGHMQQDARTGAILMFGPPKHW